MSQKFTLICQLLYVFFALASSHIAYSQVDSLQDDPMAYYKENRRFLFDFGMGASGYLGDLSERSKAFNQANVVTSMSIGYKLTKQLQPTFSISAMRLGADDKNNNDPFLKARNLNFETFLWDVNLGLQYNVMDEEKSRVAPYFFGGIGLFHFNPYTKSADGSKVYLEPIGTEGQYLDPPLNEPYALTQFQIPFGGGLAFNIDNMLNIKADFLFRKIFTDYLDDVSTHYINPDISQTPGPSPVRYSYRGNEINPQAPYPGSTDVRGNPDKKDAYFTIMLKIGYRF